MFKVIGVIVLILALGILVFLQYAGFFNKVAISEGQTGPYTLVYVKGTGSYKNSYKSMQTVYDWLNEKNIKSTKGFGYYYDDPRKVPENDLRYIAGCIIEDNSRINEIKEKFMVGQFKAMNCVIAVFPYTSKLNIIAGVIKVYPELAKYLSARKYPMNAIMEIYDSPNKQIMYILALEPGFDALKYLEPSTEKGKK